MYYLTRVSTCLRFAPAARAAWRRGRLRPSKRRAVTRVTLFDQPNARRETVRLARWSPYEWHYQSSGSSGVGNDYKVALFERTKWFQSLALYNENC